MSLVTLQRGRDGELMAVYLQGSNNRVMTEFNLYGSPCIIQLQRVHGISKLIALFLS